MEGYMRFEVVLTEQANAISQEHMLQHYRKGVLQEDLCFAVWQPSTGKERRTALIDEILLPRPGERNLHGNVSFEPQYLARAIQTAREKGAGLVFMHSHPTDGWQDMSTADIEAEQYTLAYPAGATDLPLVGLTLGQDGYWSARFWESNNQQMRRHWCEKVRVVGPKSYDFHFNNRISPLPERRNILRRTVDTWGYESQSTIGRLRVGIVGLGSVGSIVAEALARIGVSHITLIDPDIIEEHNLDRLLNATAAEIGQQKVQLAAASIAQHATADHVSTTILPISIHNTPAYEAALDCDVLFSCVDRPIARDVLNYIAHAHLIPVIDGGIAVETNRKQSTRFSAHWRAHIVTPFHQCLRCNGQYNSSMVIMELDGSLDDPSYISNLPVEQRASNQNVFPFSLSAAAMEVNLMLRYILSPSWWPLVRQQDYQFVAAETRIINEECHPHCSFRGRRALGDKERPFYIAPVSVEPSRSGLLSIWRKFLRIFGMVCLSE